MYVQNGRLIYCFEIDNLQRLINLSVGMNIEHIINILLRMFRREDKLLLLLLFAFVYNGVFRTFPIKFKVN